MGRGVIHRKHEKKGLFSDNGHMEGLVAGLAPPQERDVDPAVDQSIDQAAAVHSVTDTWTSGYARRNSLRARGTSAVKIAVPVKPTLIVPSSPRAAR